MLASLRNTWRRLRHTLQDDGARRLGSRSLLSPHPSTLPASAAIHPFDITHGVDTSGLIFAEDLASGHSSDAWSSPYYAIAPSIFTAVLDRLAPAIAFRWDRFSFVDLGSGKGRALLLAARLPFAGILGVELNPALARIARTNVHHATAPGHLTPLACTRIEVRNQDAATVTYPATPLIVFLYHPFAAPVLERALACLEHSLHENPRETWVLYVNAEHEHVFQNHTVFVRAWEQVFTMAVADVLADRTDSTVERVAAFHVTPAAAAS